MTLLEKELRWTAELDPGQSALPQPWVTDPPLPSSQSRSKVSFGNLIFCNSSRWKKYDLLCQLKEESFPWNGIKRQNVFFCVFGWACSRNLVIVKPAVSIDIPSCYVVRKPGLNSPDHVPKMDWSFEKYNVSFDLFLSKTSLTSILSSIVSMSLLNGLVFKMRFFSSDRIQRGDSDLQKQSQISGTPSCWAPDDQCSTSRWLVDVYRVLGYFSDQLWLHLLSSSRSNFFCYFGPAI